MGSCTAQSTSPEEVWDGRHQASGRLGVTDRPRVCSNCSPKRWPIGVDEGGLGRVLCLEGRCGGDAGPPCKSLRVCLCLCVYLCVLYVSAYVPVCLCLSLFCLCVSYCLLSLLLFSLSLCLCLSLSICISLTLSLSGICLCLSDSLVCISLWCLCHSVFLSLSLCLSVSLSLYLSVSVPVSLYLSVSVYLWCLCQSLSLSGVSVTPCLCLPWALVGRKPFSGQGPEEGTGLPCPGAGLLPRPALAPGGWWEEAVSPGRPGPGRQAFPGTGPPAPAPCSWLAFFLYAFGINSLSLGLQGPEHWGEGLPPSQGPPLCMSWGPVGGGWEVSRTGPHPLGLPLASLAPPGTLPVTILPPWYLHFLAPVWMSCWGAPPQL